MSDQPMTDQPTAVGRPDPETDGLTRLWVPSDKVNVARELGAIEAAGAFWIDPESESPHGRQLYRMFGTRAARERYEASAGVRDGTVADRTETAPATSAAPAPSKPTETTGAHQLSEAPEEPSPEAAALLEAVLASEGGPWRWSPDAAGIGMHPGAAFTLISAVHVPGEAARLELYVDYRPHRAENEAAGFADLPPVAKAEFAAPRGMRAPELATALATVLRRADAEPAAGRDAADLSAANGAASQEPAAEEPADEPAEQTLLDAMLAVSGGAKGPAVEWLGGAIDRPRSFAITGMRGQVTNARMSRAGGRVPTLSVTIDYRPFADVNAAVLKDAGKDGSRFYFETVDFVGEPGAANPLAALQGVVAANLRRVGAPERALAPGVPTAAEERASDERMLMAEAANAELARDGIEPVRPILPPNPSPEASRVYFWTARESDSPWCYKKLDALALEHFGRKFDVDCDKTSPTGGLRYIEATQDQVAALPEPFAFFLTEDARQAHLRSKAARDQSRKLMSEAAATAAVEVTTARKPAKLTPLVVPHPNRERDGWNAAFAAIERISTEKLIKLVKLTQEARRELSIKEAMAKTIGEDLSGEDIRTFDQYSNGIRLGIHILKDRRRVNLAEVGIREEETTGPDNRRLQGVAAGRAGVEPQADRQEPRAPARGEPERSQS